MWGLHLQRPESQQANKPKKQVALCSTLTFSEFLETEMRLQTRLAYTVYKHIFKLKDARLPRGWASLMTAPSNVYGLDHKTVLI